MSSIKSYSLGDRRSFSLSFFQGKNYIHIRDTSKGNKSVSLTESELNQLGHYIPKINLKFKQMMKRKAPPKKLKKTTAMFSDEEDNMEETDDDDE